LIIKEIALLKSMQNILPLISDQYFKDKIYCEFQQMNYKRTVNIF
jgi:hypothetical protein